MKKSLKWTLLLGVIIALASCQQQSVNFSESDLYGTWQEDGTEAYVRFLTAAEDTIDGEYKFGYEWDLNEDVKPEDLMYHGNGWFKWKLVEAELTELHLMDNQGAPIPKIYTVSKLTSTEMLLKDNYKREHSFNKVVLK